MSKVEVKCKQCQSLFMARIADRKRGWGRFCSKSCKAKKQVKSNGGSYTAYQRTYENYADYVDDTEYLGNFVEEQCYTWTKP